MQLRLKEDPKEWRKSVLLAVFGLGLVSSVLRWRRLLPATAWLVILVILAAIAVSAVVSPAWFRGYYRLSMRLGFALSQVVARLLLVVIFVFLVTPLGLFLRVIGKDTLRLKRRRDASSYWAPARNLSPLDRMF